MAREVSQLQVTREQKQKLADRRNVDREIAQVQLGRKQQQVGQQAQAVERQKRQRQEPQARTAAPLIAQAPSFSGSLAELQPAAVNLQVIVAAPGEAPRQQTIAGLNLKNPDAQLKALVRELIQPPV